jgi:hypothetical protein
LMGPGSPFPVEDWGVSPGASGLEVPGRRDVAISVRGAQASRADQLEKTLEAESRPSSGGTLDVFLYISEREPSMNATYDLIRKARVQILWISHEYLDASPENSVTLHELANAIFAWARQNEVAVDEVHLKDLPADRDQCVVVLYDDSPSFSFFRDSYSRTHKALEAMVQYLSSQVQTAGTEQSTVRDSKHKEKFATAAGLSQAFCRFYTDQIAGQSQYLEKAPASSEEHAAVARRFLAAFSRLIGSRAVSA